jgi:hypothetical protein
MARAPRRVKWMTLLETFVADLRIVSKEQTTSDDGGTPLNLWRSQKRVLDFIGNGLDDGIHQFFILKSRQLGVTTLTYAIDLFWLAMNPNLIAAIVVDNEENRNAARTLLKFYIKSFPENYFGESFSIKDKGGDNRNFMAFTNGSRVDFLIAGTRNTGRAWGEGRGYAMAHLTEVAKFGDPDAVDSFEEAFAQTNPNRLYIYESTAKGFNHWRTRWTAAFDDGLTKRAMFVGWWAGDTNIIARSDPRFALYGGHAPDPAEREKIAAVMTLYDWKITPEQLAWIRWREATVDAAQADMLSQNQPWTSSEAFVQSGTSFFHVRMIGNDIKKIVDGGDQYAYVGYRYLDVTDFFDLRMVMIEDQSEIDLVDLRVWEEPVVGAQYVIGFDPAYGRNEHKDRNCIQVFRCFADKLIQVAEYATANVDTKFATWVLAHLAGAYEDCILNVEITGPGRLVMMEMDHLRGMMKSTPYQKKVSERSWEEALDKARWYLYARVDSVGGRGTAYNFETTWRTKPELMFQMRGCYVTKELVIKSTNLLQEMMIVVQDGNEIGAPESAAEDCKDDRVIATALAIRAWNEHVRPNMLAQGMTYERVLQEADGSATLSSRNLNGLVFRFLKTQEELAEEVPRAPSWLTSRGLR